MDLSKLPKLSNSSESAPPPLAAEQQSTPPTPAAPRPQGITGDIWFNVVVGIILLYFGRTFLFWVIATLTGQPFHTGWFWPEDSPQAGEETYFELTGFTAFTDIGMFLFGLAVLFETIAVAIAQTKPSGPSRSLVLIALGLTVVCTLFNLFVSIKLMSIGIAPILSGLATAFGGYMVASLRGVLRNSRT